MRIKKTQTRSADSPASTKSKGAVGADSGASKAEIVQKMVQTIAQKGLTQRVVGELLGISQPKVSLMLRGQLNSYTTDELSSYLKILNGQAATSAPAAKTKAKTKAPKASAAPKASKALKASTATKAAKAPRATKASKAETSSNLASKTAIVKQISKEISRSGLSQRVVGNLLGISQPKISLMLRGQVNAYTTDQLSNYLNILTRQSGADPAAAKTGRRGPKPGPKAKDKSKAATATKASTKASSAGDSASKAEIVKRIDKEIKSKGISQRVVGELLGLSQPQVSLLLRGRYNSYSTEQLSNYLNALIGQAAAAAAPAGRRKNDKAATAKAPGRPAKIKAQPVATTSSAGTDTPNWMLEEIAYLRQQLAIAGSERGDDQLLAEIDYLRRANAELQKKTERFDKMAALLSV
jgi:predicted XRE-type DNA-binding protein